jgi:hypothetical protein
MIGQEDLDGLVNAASIAGFKVSVADLQIVVWRKGLNHIPTALPRGFAAIYIFKWNTKYLKVGKVNTKSSARYHSQHYNPDSSNSNLSKTLLKEPEFEAMIGIEHPGVWLKKNTTRFNILIPASLGKNFVHFAEAFFILKCNPMFENTRA